MDYPQHWLKEHKAVATDKGWARANGELLKCQKGLESEPEVPEVPEQGPDDKKPEVEDPKIEG